MEVVETAEVVKEVAAREAAVREVVVREAAKVEEGTGGWCSQPCDT